MNVKIRVKVANLCGGSIAQSVGWQAEDRTVSVDISELDEAQLTKLETVLEANIHEPESVAALRKIKTYRKLCADPAGAPVPSLEALPEAVFKYLKDTPHRWVFEEQRDEQMVPWHVESVIHHKGRGEDRPYVNVNLVAVKMGQKEKASKYVNSAEVRKKNVVEILEQLGLYVENEEIMLEYAAENERYRAVCDATGKQFLATGWSFECKDNNSWWRNSGRTAMEVDGRLTKIVMDDAFRGGERSERQDAATTEQLSHYWRKDTNGEKEVQETEFVELPVQHYLKVFDLSRHTHCEIHVANITEYTYDLTAMSKLVMDHEKKELVEMLVRGAGGAMEDIVKGKTGGVIVICTGLPGTGKTLTAEVLSEGVERPLYCVQCSQLGTDEKTLEKELATVLSRAQRWGAVLLLDEADVYVHQRGSDIRQNAIVGVFLRVLEYYRGVLFLTSNRAIVIDDAIMSRAVAWLRYKLPNQDQAAQIWSVLATNYGVELSTKDINTLVKDSKIGAASGRSIKNLLRLAKMQATSKGTKVDAVCIKYVSQFVDIGGEGSQ